MYTLSGYGTLGQTASGGPKVITMDQVARELIKDLLNFPVPIIGFKLGSAVPNTVEGVLINVAAVALQKEFADALNVTKDEAHTDNVGFKLAYEICNQMHNYGIIFTDDGDSMTNKGDGLIWLAMVGDSWQSPGELAKFISNKLEEIVTELTGVEATAPPPDQFGFGDETTTPTGTPVIKKAAYQDFEAIAPHLISEGIEFKRGAKGTGVPSGGLPIVPLAIAGIAALLLLGKG